MYHFILYFRDKAAKILKAAHQHRLKFILPNNNVDNNLLLTDNIQNIEMAKIKEIFFQKTRVHRLFLEDPNQLSIVITDREIDCMLHLLNNKTADETAKLMNLSRRTVETYLYNIKSKFDCNKKSDLIKKLKKYHLLSNVR